MSEQNQICRLSEENQYRLSAINRLAVGSIILIWGCLLTLKQVGVIGGSISTLPFGFVAFGILLIFGGIYRLSARDRTAPSTNVR